MNKVIIYKTENDKISIIYPAACELTIEEIAQKDVPSGCTYYIVDASEIPTDRTFREAWTWE
jgi:hypothetical protein